MLGHMLGVGLFLPGVNMVRVRNGGYIDIHPQRKKAKLRMKALVDHADNINVTNALLKVESRHEGSEGCVEVGG